jgi:HEAT repeat protein
LRQRFSGPLEDEPVVLLRDLAHSYAEVAAPHRLVRDECEIGDQRLELKGFEEGRDRPDLHAEGEDLVAHHFTQKDVTELADIISSPVTRRAARLAAIRALGRWGDPSALELLSSLTNHQDIDNRRYAREAIGSIRLRHGV